MTTNAEMEQHAREALERAEISTNAFDVAEDVPILGGYVLELVARVKKLELIRNEAQAENAKLRAVVEALHPVMEALRPILKYWAWSIESPSTDAEEALMKALAALEKP